MALSESLFSNKDHLNQAFARKITTILRKAIEEKGRACLVVSGGRTPQPLFAQLASKNIPWDKVDITLADERWVGVQDEASNEKMVREHLLQSYASTANFISLTTESADANDGVDQVSARLADLYLPIDVLILGMGEDGHTASLFPCSEQIEQGLDLESGKTVLAVQPTTAPNQRISMTLPMLLNSDNTFLHLTGEKKREVLMEALKVEEHKLMPISAVIHHSDVALMWAP